MKARIWFILVALCAMAWGWAIWPLRSQPANDLVINAPTIPLSGTITANLTYQLLLAPVANPQLNPGSRHSITFENNTVSGAAFSTDLCYLMIAPPALAAQITAGTTTTSSTVTVNGKSVTAGQASMVFSAGGSYGRYQSYLPQDTLFVTCATMGDSFYADTQ